MGAIEDLNEVLKKSLGASKEYVAIAKVDAKVYQQTNINIIGYFTNIEKIPGVYVTLNKPYSVIVKSLMANKINPEMIIFIDAVTKIASNMIKKESGCLFIGSPEDLSDISIAMDQAVRALPEGERFLFFDSLDTLLIYNKPVTVAQFIHFLSGKMRSWGVKGIIISLEKESSRELIEELSQFCDIMLDL